MKTITAQKIKAAVSDLCVLANLILRSDILLRLKKAYKAEKNKKAKEVLNAIITNAKIARIEKLAICQDTGMPCVFVEIGQAVRIQGNLKKAIIQGVESGYKKASLRNSVVRNPLQRRDSKYGPPVIHIDTIEGDKLNLTVLPKGFGCENKTQLKMFRPTAALKEIKDFIIKVVKDAGPDACPPYVVGVGIGGTADYACFLAKKALIKPVKSKVSGLEQDLVNEINRLAVGPMGVGGKNTVLGVNLETYPTHIAGLPVCVNISCHALRSARRSL